MSKQVFKLPDLGEGLTEATIIEWLVAVGDNIKVDQVIAEVETKKSIVELPSPYAGTVTAIYGAAGDEVPTGSPVLEVATEIDSAELENYRKEERAGSGNVLIGYGTGAGPAKAVRRRKSAPEHKIDSAANPVTATVSADSRETDQSKTGPVAVRSPIVRRLAKDLGVDLKTVTATGADGAITRNDVLTASQTLTASQSSAKATSFTAVSTGTTAPTGSDAFASQELQVLREEAFSPLRKAVSEKMSVSRAEIPEATVWVDVDITDLWNMRGQMQSENTPKPSLTAIFARFVLIALEEYPLLASRINKTKDGLIVFDGVNLGLAVDTPRGLMVPKVELANRLSIAALDTQIRELGAEARSGKISHKKLSGSTFTLNNYGALGVDGSAAVINHPEVAILGIGRIIEKPWVYEGEIMARRITQLSLVFDHRVCDGGYAAGFLKKVVELLEKPLSAYPLI